jgi:hypothetical protein
VCLKGRKNESSKVKIREEEHESLLDPRRSEGLSSIVNQVSQLRVLPVAQAAVAQLAEHWSSCSAQVDPEHSILCTRAPYADRLFPPEQVSPSMHSQKGCAAGAAMVKRKDTSFERVIQRADELSEFVVLYWKEASSRFRLEPSAGWRGRSRSSTPTSLRSTTVQR